MVVASLLAVFHLFSTSLGKMFTFSPKAIISSTNTLQEVGELAEVLLNVLHCSMHEESSGNLRKFITDNCREWQEQCHHFLSPSFL